MQSSSKMTKTGIFELCNYMKIYFNCKMIINVEFIYLVVLGLYKINAPRFLYLSALYIMLMFSYFYYGNVKLIITMNRHLFGSR